MGMVQVENKSRSTIKVGDVIVKPGVGVTLVNEDALTAMTDKKAGPASNALAKELKKMAGRPAQKKDDAAMTDKNTSKGSK